MHKAERSGCIMRERDGQWYIAKLRVQTRGSAYYPLTGLAYLRKGRGCPAARGTQQISSMKAPYGNPDCFEIVSGRAFRLQGM